MQELVDQLMDMGFSELRAHKALVRTSNSGVEPAVAWLSEHQEDADIDEHIAVQAKSQEEMSEETARALAGGKNNLSHSACPEPLARLPPGMIISKLVYHTHPPPPSLPPPPPPSALPLPLPPSSTSPRPQTKACASPVIHHPGI